MRLGSGFNLPPGCYERDLPGYYDIEADVDFICNGTDGCGHKWTEEDASVDERGCDGVEADCPACGVTAVAKYRPPVSDY